MIELEQISKTYKVSKRNAGLKKACKSYFKREYTEVKALDNISFKINEGEMVGYIGPNGARKINHNKNNVWNINSQLTEHAKSMEWFHINKEKNM